ncbi:MAG: hypothetical protein JWL95_2997 [Gemmatimonadetes bacterium]|nr:hypothetical protein [Gemmatimonadota bacterium]
MRHGASDVARVDAIVTATWSKTVAHAVAILHAPVVERVSTRRHVETSTHPFGRRR